VTREQSALTWIALHEQRYRECDGRREAEQGVNHDGAKTTPPQAQRSATVAL